MASRRRVDYVGWNDNPIHIRPAFTNRLPSIRIATPLDLFFTLLLYLFDVMLGSMYVCMRRIFCCILI